MENVSLAPTYSVGQGDMFFLGGKWGVEPGKAKVVDPVNGESLHA